jgi:hypothetical protein
MLDDGKTQDEDYSPHRTFLAVSTGRRRETVF